jgi:hypothetical protein
VVNVEGGPPPVIGSPKPLFKTEIFPTFNLDHMAVGPGGAKFLLRSPIGREESTINIVLDWTAALNR